MSTITWYGHSAFKIACGDASCVIDPFFAPRWGQKPDEIGNTNMVLVTHDHGDHVGDAVDICKKTGAMLGAVVGTAAKLRDAGVPEPQILNGIGFNIGGTLTVKGISVTMTQAFHSSDSSVPVGYILHMPDGLVIYHAGDTGIFSSMELLGRLYGIHVALLPMGGVFTMDAVQAARASRLIGCAAVVPMHWGTFPALAQNVDGFRKELADACPGCSCVELTPGQAKEFTLTQNGLRW